MIRIVVIEDEAIALRRILLLLEKSPIQVEVVQTLDSVRDTINFLTSRDDFDLILQDIHLSDGNSLDIYRQIEVKKPVLFITAYDEYALQAFKQLSVDYLLKPLKKEELYAALQKFDRFFSGEKLTTASTENHESSRYLIRVGNHLKTVDKNEVAFYYTSAKITYLMTFDDKKYPLELSLEQVEASVGTDFFRVNRQYIVHKKSIEQIHKHSKSRIRLKLKGKVEDIIISTEKSPAFKEWIIS